MQPRLTTARGAALPRAREAAARPRPNGSWRRPSRPPICAGRPTRRWPPAARGEFPLTLGGTNRDGLDDDLYGPQAAQPAGGLALAALLHARRRAAAGGRRRRRDRAVLAVRGAAARAGGADRGDRRRSGRELRRGARLRPGDREGGSRPARLSESARAGCRVRRRARDREPQRRHARGLDRLRARRCRTPVPPRSS